MQQPTAPGSPALPTPRFYLTPNRRLGPGSLLLALAIALCLLFAVSHALGRSHNLGTQADNDDDDPSRVDTFYVGGPDQAPVAKRPSAGPSTVHPFVVVRLPGNGDQLGQIPATPAGHVLYAWLAAFNGTDPSALTRALPTAHADLVQAAQQELRRETGGFTLLSAKEIQPGVIVFRLHDQTPAETQVLGTLQLNPDTLSPTILTFSLRALPAPHQAAPQAASAPHQP